MDSHLKSLNFISGHVHEKTVFSDPHKKFQINNVAAKRGVLTEPLKATVIDYMML